MLFASLTEELVQRRRSAMGSVTIYAALGKAIARHRARISMTQQDLADAIGISRASVANIERGKQRVYLDQVFLIIDAFGLIGLDELLAGTGFEKQSTASVNLSGDQLKRNQKRQVKNVVERYMAAA